MSPSSITLYELMVGFTLSKNVLQHLSEFDIFFNYYPSH